MNKKELIDLLGTTDQEYKKGNSPYLALRRGLVRMALAELSQQKDEALYLLKQAIVILEVARYSFDEMAMTLYLDLSLTLAQAYLMSHHLNKQASYAAIAEQILKPLAHHRREDIYEALADSAKYQGKSAFYAHWKMKAKKATLTVNDTKH